MSQVNRAIFSLSLLLISPLATAKPWKSGEILTNESFRYGAFEARMKGSLGSGAISAFYLLKDGSWEPGQEWQELDFEILGKEANLLQSQVMLPGAPRTESNVFHRTEKTLSKDFNVYRMEWTPDSLSFYFNGELLRKETDPDTYAKFLDPKRVEDMRLRFSLWVGFSNWSGILNPEAQPTPFYVDWVKVYSYESKSQSFALSWEDQFDSLDASRWNKAQWTFEYAVNDFTAEQVSIEDGVLKIEFAPQ